MRRVWALCAVLASLLLAADVTGAVWNITYPRALNDNDVRNDYPIALLTLALDKTGVRYQLKPSDRIMLQGKSLRQLRENRSVNVVWSMTDAQRETDLLPIRIPIHKGLIGWRVFIIHRDKQRAFSAIQSLAALQRYIPVQGEDWPDTKILQSNGFDVESVTQYLDNFNLITRFQADFFPRSVVEINMELAMDNIDPELVLEESLAIHYPAAMYFFVNRTNPTLAKLIETGLQRAIEDGSFDQLFLLNYQPVLEQLNIPNRRVFELENPLMTAETPVDDEKLWFTIDMSRNPARSE
ncbi:amino acid ABC transporter substrate-binding protein [Alteromonas sp. ASW11-36]|uniref:Amino acid ABC transporter substrate-binding protein n=1 Tax=Alteromonas arenosi TaxID=3055817 RepID=A0ABT7SV19_9ALTE|nr:amino acid ABC transporter substrate-binding protein [Alteromonas sp. ASW11-36]MDM7860010.1 amino acid ABC transporter substrate-binding protein [Alteromonas sp. ASW11-36]